MTQSLELTWGFPRMYNIAFKTEQPPNTFPAKCKHNLNVTQCTRYLAYLEASCTVRCSLPSRIYHFFLFWTSNRGQTAAGWEKQLAPQTGRFHRDQPQAAAPSSVALQTNDWPPLHHLNRLWRYFNEIGDFIDFFFIFVKEKKLTNRSPYTSNKDWFVFFFNK